MRCLMGLLCAAWMCAGQGLEARVEELLKQFPGVARGAWGAYAVDLASGRVVYQRDAGHTFVPASNNKLFATGLALTRLGPAHMLTTRVYATKGPDANGVVDGDIVLEGAGDPSLSGREWPYKKDGAWGEALGPLDELAAAVWARGVRRIRGGVVGDDRAYIYEPFPPGWALDDTLSDYGAPVSALVLHDNFVTVRVEAGRPGEIAHVGVIPETGYFQVVNRVVSAANRASRVNERRSGDGRTIELDGVVAEGSPVSVAIALDDAARYAAHAFERMLTRRGIVVEGAARARHRHAGEAATNGEAGAELARRVSPPLEQMIQVANKVSQNLHAELLLREVARAGGKEGSRRAALAELGAWLRSIGARGEDYALYDASGLSRLALVSPETAVRVLKTMYEGPHREAWVASLPEGGEDGTLSRRFKGWTGGRVRAKTGTLTHVTALAGYLETTDGATIAFSVMANNANTNAAGIRGFADGLVKALAEEWQAEATGARRVP